MVKDFFGVISFELSKEARIEYLEKIRSGISAFKNTDIIESECYSVLQSDTNHPKICTSTSDFCREGKSVTLLGDQFGFYPIYYIHKKNILLISSRQSYLLNFTVSAELNETVLCELLTLGCVLPPDTLIKGIYSLPTTSSLIFYSNNTVKLLDRFHEPKVKYSKLYSGDDEVESRLVQSLSKIVATENLGVMCSGGLDSTLICSLLHHDLKKDFKPITLITDKKSQDFQIVKYLSERLNLTNDIIFPTMSNFLNGVYGSIYHGESEMVGALSLNASIEHMVASHTAKIGYSTVLTGDDNWITPKNILAQTPGYYALKYGVVPNPPNYFPILMQNKSILNYCNKYSYIMSTKSSDTKREDLKKMRWNIHATMIGKIIGKIRMGVDSAPTYFFPFLQNNYISLINTLNENSNEEYRDILRRLILKKNTLTSAQLSRPRTWMPSFFDNHSDAILKFIIKNILDPEGVACIIFGKRFLLKFIECDKTVSYKNQGIMTLFYLNIFYDIFISHREIPWYPKR